MQRTATQSPLFSMVPNSYRQLHATRMQRGQEDNPREMAAANLTRDADRAHRRLKEKAPNLGVKPSVTNSLRKLKHDTRDYDRRTCGRGGTTSKTLTAYALGWDREL
jgi:hypothetical protein